MDRFVVGAAAFMTLASVAKHRARFASSCSAWCAAFEASRRAAATDFFTSAWSLADSTGASGIATSVEAAIVVGAVACDGDGDRDEFDFFGAGPAGSSATTGVFRFERRDMAARRSKSDLEGLLQECRGRRVEGSWRDKLKIALKSSKPALSKNVF